MNQMGRTALQAIWQGGHGSEDLTAGEGLLIATVPAITNAIYDAVGVRISELPITPEKILEGMKKG